MAEYALSTNLWGFVQVIAGTFTWQRGEGEAENLNRMGIGDVIIPKFSQNAAFSDTDAQNQDQYFTALGLELEDPRPEYDAVIQAGVAAVPYLLRVTSPAVDRTLLNGMEVVEIGVEKEDVPYPLTTQEFLRLRSLPHNVAVQFKGAVGRGRHIQEVPLGLASAIRAVGASPTRDAGHLRRFSVVNAQDAAGAVAALSAAGRTPRVGDSAFLVTSAALPGLAQCHIAGELKLLYEPIAQSPEQVKELLLDAQRKAGKKDQFAPREALAACDEIAGMVDHGDSVLAVDDFSKFHDRYDLLAQKTNQAIALATRPLLAPAEDESSSGQEPEPAEEAEDYARLTGLTVDAVAAALPEGFVIDETVIASAVSALRAGKHLLLAGPPGSGKTTLGEALCRAVVNGNYAVTTATADWTTFDTIGGYVPTPGGLEFSAGLILRALRDGQWVLLDEINRADIDKAFGPLFTVLSGSDNHAAGRRSLLPYQSEGKSIAIEWANSRAEASSPYCLTPLWRLIGTLNIADKASLFQLSFAFLRRFAVVDVPNPDSASYAALIGTWVESVPAEYREITLQTAAAVALGPVSIGPAILRDFVRFIAEGLTPTASGSSPFARCEAALWAAVRLFITPQYEGRPAPDGRSLVSSLQVLLPGSEESEITETSAAFEAVAL